MPFLTEELWQRLPRRPNDKTESIVIAEYPEFDASYHSPDAEAAYELVLDCSRGIRSLMAEYSIKEDGEAYVQALDVELGKTANAQQAAIRTLAGKGLTKLEILAVDAPKPRGCAVFPVSASATVFVHVQGRIDIDQEIEKAQARLASAKAAQARQEKIVGAMQGSASGAVVEGERRKLKDAGAETSALEAALEQFQALKVEA